MSAGRAQQNEAVMIRTAKQPIPQGHRFVRYVEDEDGWAVEIEKMTDEESEMRAALGEG